MAEVLTVLTFKGADHIVEDGGTQSWVISPRRARRCDYVVCVRHKYGPHKPEGSEPHKHAFLIGKVSDVVQSDENEDRFKVVFSEYAVLEGPEIPLKSASPTQYFPSLRSIGIDENSITWKPLCGLLSERSVDLSESTPSIEDRLDDSPEEKSWASEQDRDVPGMSVIMRAKKLVADAFHVPLSHVEIVVRV